MENKILIDSVNNLKVALNEISVYDFDVYTSMELYYKIAENFNKVIRELSRFEGVISEEIVKQNEKLIYLLGEGLNQEVVDKINEMVEEGIFDTIINHNIFNNLKNDINNLNSELEQNKNEIKSKNFPQNYNGPICTFIDDDTGFYVRDIWDSIIQEKNIKMGFACPTGYICGDLNAEGDTAAYKPMTIQELEELYKDGHDIYSHSYSHPAFYSESTTLGQIEEECIKSKKWLETNGFTRASNIIVYPGGLGQNLVNKKNIIRKYYKYGIDTVGGGGNPSPFDSWSVYRINADTMSLEELKAKVNKSYINNEWLIFMTHAYELNKDKINQVQKIKDLIDYIHSKNIPIMQFTEAEKLKGNEISIGEFTENGLFASKNSKNNFSNVVYSPMSSSTFNPLLLNINDFKKDAITISMINYECDTFRNRGGVLKTHKTSNESYSYQEFVTIDTNEVYIRFWNESTWGAWINTSDTIIDDNIVDDSIFNKPITSFLKNKEYVYMVNNSNNAPVTGNAGIYKVYRYQNDLFSYSTWKSQASEILYGRRWVGSAWTAWKKMNE